MQLLLLMPIAFSCQKVDEVQPQKEGFSTKEYDYVCVDINSLWNSYFVNLQTAELTPIVNEEGYTATNGKLKLATDVQVSPSQDYLLYRSNINTSKTDGNKCEWFVQEVATGAQIKLERASIGLFSNEIGFIDGTHIVISYDEQMHTLIFDCQTR